MLRMQAESQAGLIALLLNDHDFDLSFLLCQMPHSKHRDASPSWNDVLPIYKEWGQQCRASSSLGVRKPTLPFSGLPTCLMTE